MTTEQQDLNAKVAALLGLRASTNYDSSVMVEVDGGWIHVDDYASDVNAAMEACLALGYVPFITSEGVWSVDEATEWLNVGITNNVNVPPKKTFTVMTSFSDPNEITQAIATALCEALVAAKGVGDES
jgi:hypothetical protein